MEQKDIDIYEILKDEEHGTELYTPICGRVWHSGMANDKDSAKAIWTEDEAGREHFFDKNGKVSKEGEVLLFPSKEMRDWNNFFKKGDVLEYKKGNNQATCLFDSYKDDTTKLRFIGLYTLTKGKIWDTPTNWDISDWVKSDNPAAYIETIEERLGGKLNRKTLEIEKTQPDFRPFDKVLVRSGDNCKWLPALFVRDRGEGFAWRYKVLPIHSGKVADFTSCIPFEGHENIAFTDYDFVDLPF